MIDNSFKYVQVWSGCWLLTPEWTEFYKSHSGQFCFIFVSVWDNNLLFIILIKYQKPTISTIRPLTDRQIQMVKMATTTISVTLNQSD